MSSDFYDEKPFRLDVLVCGRCHSAFHLFDAFRSHSKTCDGDESNAECADDSAEAVAMVIWCNTIRRKIEEQLPADRSDPSCDLANRESCEQADHRSRAHEVESPRPRDYTQ